MISTFKDLAIEDEEWTKGDLKELIDDLEYEDLMYISNEVLEIVSHYSDYELEERMKTSDLKKAKLKRRKPAYKKAMRLKKKCMSKYGNKVRDSKGKANSFVCGTDGKIHKGKSKKFRRELAKTRKRNKSKII